MIFLELNKTKNSRKNQTSPFYFCHDRGIFRAFSMFFFVIWKMFFIIVQTFTFCENFVHFFGIFLTKIHFCSFFTFYFPHFWPIFLGWKKSVKKVSYFLYFNLGKNTRETKKKNKKPFQFKDSNRKNILFIISFSKNVLFSCFLSEHVSIISFYFLILC